MKNIKESHFVSQQESDEILDKISEFGIESLSKTERKRLELFSQDDIQIISTIEEVANIMQEFTEINNKIKELVDNGYENDGKRIYINEWQPLHIKLSKLEKQIIDWGIDLGDPRLVTMLKEIKPSLFFSHEDDGMDESRIMENLEYYEVYKYINEGTWAYSRKDTEEMINALKGIKNPDEINDEFYKVWWNKVGDDILYDELDKAKDEPQNWQSYVYGAIERLKEMLKDIKDDTNGQNNQD